MKIKNIMLLSVLTCGLFSCAFKIEIKDCYISYTGSKKLTAALPERLPKSSTPRQITINTGEVEISVMDGYRILYNNVKSHAFVNLKVELSEPKSYGRDTLNVLANLQYLNSSGSDMESKDLIQLSYNGYKIYGLSRSAIEKGNTLGVFALFPGDDVIVYIYFNNLEPEYRNFENLLEYKTERNEFLGNYTYHLKSCKNK